MTNKLGTINIKFVRNFNLKKYVYKIHILYLKL